MYFVSKNSHIPSKEVCPNVKTLYSDCVCVSKNSHVAYSKEVCTNARKLYSDWVSDDKDCAPFRPTVFSFDQVLKSNPKSFWEAHIYYEYMLKKATEEERVILNESPPDWYTKYICLMPMKISMCPGPSWPVSFNFRTLHLDSETKSLVFQGVSNDYCNFPDIIISYSKQSGYYKNFKPDPIKYHDLLKKEESYAKLYEDLYKTLTNNQGLGLIGTLPNRISSANFGHRLEGLQFSLDEKKIVFYTGGVCEFDFSELTVHTPFKLLSACLLPEWHEGRLREDGKMTGIDYIPNYENQRFWTRHVNYGV
jgi:hypothetical protein